jgi:hypothetical protein
LLDLKGCGVAPGRVPSHKRQSDGLEYLGLALYDLLIKRAIDEMCTREGTESIWTVPVYAVLDLGFDLRAGPYGRGPAGLHVRRAHRRPVAGSDRTVEDRVCFATEMLLRAYGLTTANRGGRMRIERKDGRITLYIDGNVRRRLTTPEEIGFCLAITQDTSSVTLDDIDVQLARDISAAPLSGQMVDFGCLQAIERFRYPVSRSKHMSLQTIIWPHEPEFVQPDPVLQLPLATWGREPLVAFCFSLARRLRDQEISQAEFLQSFQEPLWSLVEGWDRAGKRL